MEYISDRSALGGKREIKLLVLLRVSYTICRLQTVEIVYIPVSMLADITYEISRGFLVGIAAKETVEGNEKDGGKAKDRIET